MEFDLETPLTSIHECHLDTFPSLFLTESDHMPWPSYLKTLKSRDFYTNLRREVISSILQVSRNFNASMPYLAVNYLDRFLSSQEMSILQQPRPWKVRILAVSCVCLAAKMQKIEFSFSEIQGEGGFIFDAQTIKRLELLILGALKWRMRSITPFSFIPFFISLFKLKDPPLRKALKTRALKIIFRTQNDILLLEFKPSIIAASALLFASHELFPLQFSCFRKAILDCSYVNKDNMLQCYSRMEDITMEDHKPELEAVSKSDTR